MEGHVFHWFKIRNLSLVSLDIVFLFSYYLYNTVMRSLFCNNTHNSNLEGTFLLFKIVCQCTYLFRYQNCLRENPLERLI
jgi:hypothetical protein